MAKVLTSLGIPCGHESIFDYASEEVIKGRFNGTINRVVSNISLRDGLWMDVNTIQADSSYMSAPYLRESYMQGIPVVHVVRHPFKVISSFLFEFSYFINYYSPYEKWILKHLPGMAELETPLERACYYYVEWNKMIEASCQNRPYFRHRVEDAFSDEFFTFLNTVPQSVYDNNKANTKRISRKLHMDITHDQELLEMMARYGYALPKIL